MYERVADTHANVLLTGESGCGKEVAAKYIHACGHRSNQNFVAEDFFYQISTIVIRIPSLRERKEDLPSLIDFFVKKSQEENNILIHSLDSSVEKFLMQYDYPGDIRELKNIIDRMVILSNHGVVTEEALPILYNIGITQTSKSENYFSKILLWKEYKSESEKAYLKWVLEQLNGNVAEASKRLGISSRQIFNKIQEYKLR